MQGAMYTRLNKVNWPRYRKFTSKSTRCQDNHRPVTSDDLPQTQTAESHHVVDKQAININ